MSLAESLKPHLPYLRRYARALTGSQKSGDAFVKATLEAIIADPESISDDDNVRVQLYRIFSGIWESAHVGVTDDPDDNTAQGHLNAIPPISRQVLLLTALEGFSIREVAKIADVGESSINGLLEDAISEIDNEIRSDVLIIEDEVLISMELQQIVSGLGHNVCGTATTHKGAIEAVAKAKPSLVLADIQLADGFITAFPERLLTGERPEPTFLITKPFQPNAIRAAISQALFFSTEKQNVQA